jgi:hypothetical protein
MADRNIFRGVNSIKFHNRFKDEKDYLIYLSEISATELGAFLKKYISKEATIITDKWRGYSPL